MALLKKKQADELDAALEQAARAAIERIMNDIKKADADKDTGNSPDMGSTMVLGLSATVGITMMRHYLRKALLGEEAGA